MFFSKFTRTRLALHAPRLMFSLSAMAVLTLSLACGTLPATHLSSPALAGLSSMIVMGALFCVILLRAPEYRHIIEATGLACYLVMGLALLPATGNPLLDDLVLVADPSHLFVLGPLIWSVLRLPILNRHIRFAVRVEPVCRDIPASPENVIGRLIPDPSRPEDFWQDNAVRIDWLDAAAPRTRRVGVTRIETGWETFSTVEIDISPSARQVLLREDALDAFGIQTRTETFVSLADETEGTILQALQTVDTVGILQWLDLHLSDAAGDYWDSMRARVTGHRDTSQRAALLAQSA